MATDAKEDKLAQLKKLLKELSHEDVRAAIVAAEERLDEPEPDPETVKETPEEDKEYSISDLINEFPDAPAEPEVQA